MGDWSAVIDTMPEDSEGNHLESNALQFDCQNTSLLSRSENAQLVGIGLKETIAVAMDDAILIVNKENTQAVGKAVNTMVNAGIRQSSQHNRDFRPWGWFESLIKQDGYQVKRLVVHPNGVLSLQSHTHRS